MSQAKSRFTLYRSLVTYCVLTLVMFGVLGATGYWNARALLQQLAGVATVQLPAVRTMTLIDMSHDATRAVVMSSLVAMLTEDKAALAELKDEIAEAKHDFDERIKTLESLKLHAETLKAIQLTKPSIDRYVEAGVSIVSHAQKAEVSKAKEELASFMNLFKILEKELETLGETIEKDAFEENALGESMLQIIVWTTLIGSCLSLYLAVWILRNLKHSLFNFLREIVGEANSLNSSASTLAASSGEISQSTLQTASSLEETSSGIEELGSLVKLNNSHAVEAEKLAQECRQIAISGTEQISQLIRSIEEVAKSSKKMQEITGVIDELSFQTNLLALNAAIEAARAGEHGKGFAVVAEAVRILASKSANAAREISQHIDGSVKTILSGSSVAGESRLALTNIVEATNRICDLSSNVAASQREQSLGLSEITKAINQVDHASQRNAAVAEELAASAQELTSQANHLSHLVEGFQNQVGIYVEKQASVYQLQKQNSGSETSPSEERNAA